MTDIETSVARAAVRSELGARRTSKDPSWIKQRAIVRAAGGHLIPIMVTLPFVYAGRIPVTWGQWLSALSAVLAMASLLWLVLALGGDRGLRFDPHFLLVPAACSAPLIWLYAYLVPEWRVLVLEGWFVVLLFGAGLFAFAEVLVLTTFMVGGYLATIALLVARGEPISWSSEMAMVIPFFALTLFCGTVLERLRRDRLETKSMRSQLSYLALTDRLTGLPNRRYFDDFLERQAALCQRSGGTYAVGMFDIDHFKQINDRLGHEAGDRVLEGLAKIVRKHIRTTDLVARLGGDEFAVLMVDTNAAEAGKILERIRRAVTHHAFTAGGLQRGQVTISTGVTEAEGKEEPSGVLRRADAELYVAKRNGRNRVVVKPVRWRRRRSPKRASAKLQLVASSP